MVKLTCRCLNVQVHTKRSDLTPSTSAQLGLGSDCVGSIFSLSVTEAPLDLEGIRIEHPYLVHKKSVGGWTVNKCFICDTHTHATYDDTARVLVNCSLKAHPPDEKPDTSSNFSTLFKVVLPPHVDNRPVGTVGVQSDKYDAVEKTLKSVQDRLNKFLAAEEAAMENRIREYEEQQKAAYAELQSKARSDKNIMISMILSAQQDTSIESGAPSPPTPSTQSSQEEMTSPMSTTGSSTGSSSAPEPKLLTKSSKTDFSFLKRPNAPTTQVVKTPQKVFTEKPTKSDADADMFDMEMMEETDGARPFYHSDDENDTDDSGSLPDEGVVPTARTLYSTSVPVSVPTWREFPRGRNSSIDEDDDDGDRGPPLDPEDMAASISALARSVHTDTSAIFGERPRRKVSAFDVARH